MSKARQQLRQLVEAKPTVAEEWNRMTPAERLVWIHRDPSMRLERWQDMANRWASCSWEQMSAMQREATLDLL